MDNLGFALDRLPRLGYFLYELIQAIDPYGTTYVDIREPLEVWNYIIYTFPVLGIVCIGLFISVPVVVHFVHWAPKLLWPRLAGFPILHELLRRFEYITDPRLPTIGDLIRDMERTLNHLFLEQREEK